MGVSGQSLLINMPIFANFYQDTKIVIAVKLLILRHKSIIFHYITDSLFIILYCILFSIDLFSLAILQKFALMEHMERHFYSSLYESLSEEHSKLLQNV